MIFKKKGMIMKKLILGAIFSLMLMMSAAMA